MRGKSNRRIRATLILTGALVAGYFTAAPSAQAIEEMQCDATSDYWRIYSDVNPEICFAYAGYTYGNFTNVVNTKSGNNTGWQRMYSIVGGGYWTSFFNYKDEWKSYNEGDDKVTAVNIN